MSGGRRPDYDVVTPTENNGKTFFTKIGSAWNMQTRDGISITLNALPLNGKLLLFTPREDNRPKTQEAAPGQTTKSRSDLDDEIPF